MAANHVGWTDMYRIPQELNLSPVVGEFTTQIRVGQFDLQFTFGDVSFAIQSPVNLLRDGKLFAHWEEGQWPDAGFYEIMNTKITRCEVVNDRLIVIEFANGIEKHLEDNSNQYESMQISFKGNTLQWIIQTVQPAHPPDSLQPPVMPTFSKGEKDEVRTFSHCIGYSSSCSGY